MKLQTANVKAYSNEDCCKQRFSPSDCSSNREVIDDSIICAGSTNQPVGICFGDSGGMFIDTSILPAIILKIVSFHDCPHQRCLSRPTSQWPASTALKGKSWKETICKFMGRRINVSICHVALVYSSEIEF